MALDRPGLFASGAVSSPRKKQKTNLVTAGALGNRDGTDFRRKPADHGRKLKSDSEAALFERS